MGGEQSEMNFCEHKSLSMPTLRMTCEAKVRIHLRNEFNFWNVHGSELGSCQSNVCNS